MSGYHARRSGRLRRAQSHPEEARKFIDDAEQKLPALGVESGRADWVKATYITDDTEALAAKADERAIAATVDYAKQATRFDGLQLDPVTARKLKLLKLSLTIATPPIPRKAKSSPASSRAWRACTAKASIARGPDKLPGSGTAQQDAWRTSRDPKQLLDAWRGWHAISRPMRQDFVRYVALANKGARELGFQDNGAMWRSKYDMPPDDFAKELDRLWEQVRPLYLSLHAYVRTEAARKVRRRGSRQRPHPRAPARQYVGPGVGQHLPAGGARQRRPGYDLTAHPQEPQHR